MEIRIADLRDIEVLVLFNTNLAFESEGKVLDREVALKGVTLLLENPSKGITYVAVINEEIVGV